MERPLKEVRLPIAQKTAKIVTFYTRGEMRAIETLKYEGAKTRFANGETVIDEIPTDFIQREEDGLMLQGIKHIVDDNGQELPVNKKTLDELPDHDLGLLLKELRASQDGKNIDGEDVSTKK